MLKALILHILLLLLAPNTLYAANLKGDTLKSIEMDFPGQNTTYQENWFNTGTLITDNYVLLIQYSAYRPALWKMDLENGKLEKI